MKVLVIGGNSRLAQAFLRNAGPDIQCRIAVRNLEGSEKQADAICVASYSELPESAFEGVAAVINCVGMQALPKDRDTMNEVNIAVPLRAAEQAREAGVEHFVQVSSIYVYGSEAHIHSETPAVPDSAYGHSKLAADDALNSLRSDRFVVTVLRIPILYGRGSPNRLRTLAQWMIRTRFFVTPSKAPQRSILHLDNAAEILRALLVQRPNRVVLAADDQDFTFAHLADAIERQMGRRIHLIRLPDWVLAPLRYTLKSTYQRLFSSRFVTRDDLVASLVLPVTMEEGLADLVSGQ